jgi:hypothetical protein
VFDRIDGVDGYDPVLRRGENRALRVRDEFDRIEDAVTR